MDLAPFSLVETSPGNHSLLLTEFAPASAVFAEHGVDGGGYAWEAVARYVIEADHLDGRLGLDPEASMFCAYGEDRDALAALGRRLAALFHDRAALAAVIDELGPDAFED